MSTRATIRISDERDEHYFIYRHSDGHPENVIPDIEKVVALAEGRWTGAEIGQFISLFFATHGNARIRIQDYELTNGFHGDESYRYCVQYRGDKWLVPPLDLPPDSTIKGD